MRVEHKQTRIPEMQAIASLLLLLSGLGIGQRYLDVTSLFNFAAGLVAFFFIVVCVLIFIFVYDNMRRQRKGTAATP